MVNVGTRGALTIQRHQLKEFEKLAPKSANSTKALERVINLWTTQKAFTEADFRAIDIDAGKCTWIVAGDRDESA